MAYYPNLPAGQAKMDNSAPVVIAADQSPIAINVSTDAFEQLVVGSRYNQIEVNYSITDPDLVSEITITKTNGGDATNGSGVGVFSTGANTSGGIKAVTNNVVVYSPHFETYAAFSAIFTTGIANSYQRIGIYNDNNGFFLGYNNTIFGVTLRKGGLDTFVGQSSFNGDPLDGSANSKFLRNGLPEAVDFTKDNLYRIRFGWLGAAPITFEMLSPDCDWIAFHSIKFPNTATSASINDPSLPVTLDVQKSSAGSTVLSIATGCWGAGTTSDLQKLSANITDSTLVRVDRSILTAKTPGGSYTNIQATASNNLRTAIAEVDAGAVFPINDNGGSITVDGNVTISGAVAVTDNNGSLTVDGTVAATQSGVWNINAISGTISLPTGAATSANQTTQITALQLLDDVVATDGSAALTKLYQVGGTDGTNAQILSTNTSGHVNIADGGNSITVDGTVAATQSGTWNITNISGTVSLPTGAATETTLSGLNTKVPSGLTVTSTRLLVDGSGVTQPVSGTVTIQDGAGSITVDGSVSVSNFPATQTVTGTVTLDSATLTALETISIGNAAGVSAVNIQDGGNSITVDGTVAATQSGTWNITNISGTVSLPTGAATSANQTTQITALQLLDNVVNTAGTAAVTSLYQVGGTDGTSARILGLNASGHVKIEDGGNSITVDGTVAATQSGTWSTRTQDGAGNALTSHLAGSSRGIDVSIIDGSGNQITSFGGGTQYTEGDVDATITGTAMLWEDTSDTLRPVSSAKPLPVNIVAGSASGTEYADGTTVATPTGAAALGWDGTAVQVVRTDSTGVMAIQDNGGSLTVDGTVAISNASIPITDNGGSLTVDGSVSVSNFPATQPVSGTVELGSTSLAALETISVANFPATQPVSGTVTVQDGGGALTVDGSVSVSNFPATQPVSGTVTANAGTGTMNVSVQNASIPVTGTFFQATQPVSGTVSADTELPAAVTLADALANPTTPIVGSALLGWDGAAWDRLKTAQALDGTGAADHTGVLGVQQINKRFNPTNLGTAANSTSVVDINGSNGARITIGTTTTGTFTIEVTGDGTNWSAAEVYAVVGDNWLSGQNITPTAGASYTVLVGGWRAVRLRTVTTLGATVAHFFTLSMSQAVLSAIDTGFAPHAIGYTILNKAGEYTTTQTGVALWTPTAGRKFVITDLTISTGGTTAGIVTVWQGASADTTYTAGTDPVLFRGEFAPSATAKPGMVKSLTVPFVSSTADHILRVTTSAAMTLYIQVNGYEIV